MHRQNVFSSLKIILFFANHISKCDNVRRVGVTCYLILLGLWCPLNTTSYKTRRIAVINRFQAIPLISISCNIHIIYQKFLKVIWVILVVVFCLFRYGPIFESYLLVGSMKETMGIFYILTLFQPKRFRELYIFDHTNRLMIMQKFCFIVKMAIIIHLLFRAYGSVYSQHMKQTKNKLTQ